MTDSLEGLIRARRSRSSEPQADVSESDDAPIRVELASLKLSFSDVFALAVQIVLVQVLFGAAIAIVLYALGVFD